MTYADLLKELQLLTAEQLQQTVTVYVSGDDEFYPLVDDYPWNESDDSCDVLDPGHKYMVI